MKAINMTEEAERGLAELMAKGLGEFGNRVKSQLSCLELLALTTTRMLVSCGAVDMARLTEKGLAVLAEDEAMTAQRIGMARDNMQVVYNNEADLAAVGVTFHTWQ